MENKELVEKINKQVESLWNAINILKGEIEKLSGKKIPSPCKPEPIKTKK